VCSALSVSAGTRRLCCVPWVVPQSPSPAPAPAGASDAAIAAARLVALWSNDAPLSVSDPLAICERAVLGGPFVSPTPRAPYAVRRALTLSTTRAQAWTAMHRDRERSVQRAFPISPSIEWRTLPADAQSRAIASALCEAIDGNHSTLDAERRSLLALTTPSEPAVYGPDRALIRLLLGDRDALRSLCASAVDPLALAIAIDAAAAERDAVDWLVAAERSRIDPHAARLQRASLRSVRLLVREGANDRATIEPIGNEAPAWLAALREAWVEGCVRDEDLADLFREAEWIAAALPSGVGARSAIEAALAETRAAQLESTR
jgi:hypothetical protein